MQNGLRQQFVIAQSGRDLKFDIGKPLAFGRENFRQTNFDEITGNQKIRRNQNFARTGSNAFSHGFGKTRRGIIEVANLDAGVLRIMAQALGVEFELLARAA